MLQGYVSHLRMSLEEGRAVELDVRRLNQALYTELLAANTTIADLQDQIKFHTSVDRRETKLIEVRDAMLRWPTIGAQCTVCLPPFPPF